MPLLEAPPTRKTAEMSAIQLIIANIESLNEAGRAEVLAHFALGQIASAGSIKEVQVKAPNKNKGVPTCHGDYTRMILEQEKEAVATFKAENPDVKGAHLVFVSLHKKQHAEDYAAFEAAWKEAHPKPQADPKPLADPKPKAASEEAEVKPKRVISEEQKAKMKAGREAALAKKKALASSALVAEGEEVIHILEAALGVIEEPVVSASSAASTASSSGKSQGKKRGPKPMTEEQKAAKKAAKALAAAGAASPERSASPKVKAD